MSIYSLKEFKDNIRNIARPNRFTIEIHNPWDGVKTRPLYKDEKFKFYANKASIPQFDLTGPMFNFRGTHVQLSGDYKPEPLDIGFYSDGKWEVRAFFEDWMRACVNYDNNNRRMRMKNYRFGSRVYVNQYDSSTTKFGDDIIIAKYLYHDAVPMKISNLLLDHGQQNTIQEFTATFYYSKWERIFTADENSSRIQGDIEMDSLVQSTDGYSPTEKNNMDETSESDIGPGGTKIPIEEIAGLPMNPQTGGILWENVSDEYKAKWGRNLPSTWDD